MSVVSTDEPRAPEPEADGEPAWTATAGPLDPLPESHEPERRQPESHAPERRQPEPRAPERPAPEPAGTELAGFYRHRVVPAPLKLVQLGTGYLLARWLVLLVARYLMGHRVRTTARLRNGRLHLETESHLLGRRIGHSKESVLANDLVTLGVERRYPHLLLLAGAFGVLVGAMVGVGAVIDGIQASYVPLALFGLGVLAAGIALDIGLGALGDHLGDRTSLLIQIRSGASVSLGRRYRITGTDVAATEAFVATALELGSATTSGR